MEYLLPSLSLPRRSSTQRLPSSHRRNSTLSVRWIFCYPTVTLPYRPALGGSFPSLSHYHINCRKQTLFPPLSHCHIQQCSGPLVVHGHMDGPCEIFLSYLHCGIDWRLEICPLIVTTATQTGHESYVFLTVTLPDRLTHGLLFHRVSIWPHKFAC
jgi:hypothetical protein